MLSLVPRCALKSANDDLKNLNVEGDSLEIICIISYNPRSSTDEWKVHRTGEGRAKFEPHPATHCQCGLGHIA